jgi:hypothetical protein
VLFVFTQLVQGVLRRPANVGVLVAARTLKRLPD